MKTLASFLKQYNVACWITLLACLISLISLTFADRFAWYIQDKLMDIPSSPLKYLSIRDFFKLFNAIYFMPMIVVLANKHTLRTRISWLLLSIALMILSISMIGEGGDHKGCNGCLGVVYIYILLLPIPALLSIVFGLIHVFKNRKHC
jgi:hypothetical protein